MSSITVRPAESSDLVATAAIYAHSVAASTATFDVEEPPLASWQAKLDSTAMGDHFLVAQPNPASNAMHRRLGFTEVGTLDEVGFKFGAYVSTTWFQLRLS
jgi:L-amino acid N-acyltransferase YncA